MTSASLPRSPRASVVIPAHNEQSVIARCITTLLTQASPGEFAVVVVCNGCSDDTAERARAAGGPDVLVLEVQAASKAVALNAADAATDVFPRVYLDADIEMPTATLRSVVAALETPGAVAASPRPTLALDGHPRTVRAYYDVWTKLPWVASGVGGSGVYAVSALGRAQFENFPLLVADDLFMSKIFPARARTPVDASVVVHPPRSLRSLLRTRVRVYSGNRQFERQGVVPATGGGTGKRGLLAKLGAYRPIVSTPRLWPGLVLYVGVAGTAKLLAAKRSMTGDVSIWDRDESSRAS